MNWPEIAACLRKEIAVRSEQQGLLLGVWKDRTGNESHSIHAAYERGGTKLVLFVEVDDIMSLDPRVKNAIRMGIRDVLLVGRTVAVRHVLDTTALSRAKLEQAARETVARARELRAGIVARAG